MFGNKKQPHFDVDSTIGKNTKVYGNLVFSGGLHIDGVVVGNVIAETEGSRVTISERGRIEGDVSVHHIKLNGEVIGDVHAIKHIELATNARVKGNVYYSVIEMAKGAEVNGSLVHGEPVRREPVSMENQVPMVNSTHNFAPPVNANPAAHTPPAPQGAGISAATPVSAPQTQLQSQPQQSQYQVPQQSQPTQPVVTGQENVAVAETPAISHIKIANQGNG